MKLVKGTDLTPEQRRTVLRAFPYRPTTENGYPNNPRPYLAAVFSGMRTAPISDARWLTEHAFYVKANGDFARRPNHCEPVYLADCDSKAV